MTVGEFLDITPRLLHSLLKHARRLLEITDRQHGIQTAAIYNTAPWPQKEVADPRDFMVLPVTGADRRETGEPVHVGEKLMKLFGVRSI